MAALEASVAAARESRRSGGEAKEAGATKAAARKPTAAKAEEAPARRRKTA
jgi:hypothetical protein